MPNHQPIGPGSKGEEVKVAQKALCERMFYTGKIDGVYGDKTKNAVTHYQDQRSRQHGGWMADFIPLEPTGDIKDDTWRRLDPDMLAEGQKGETVKLLQDYLICYGYDLNLDGDFGPKTKTAVEQFQKEAGIKVDGKVGPVTWARLRS